MIEETVERLQPLVSYSNIYTIANREHSQVIGTLLPQIPKANLLVEPQGKNTAPTLILATAQIYLQNPQAVVAALPADHLIKNPYLFRQKLETAAHAASREGMLITFGIPPSYPATGYGYIQFQKSSPLRIKGEDFYPVQKFKEKPDLETAKDFLSLGNFHWNSGMFLWQPSVFEEKLRSHAPEMFSYWEKILYALKKDEESQIHAVFDEMPSISIDYALIEKAEGVLMSEGNFGWSDVGAWSSLSDIWPQDERGNALRGENITLDSDRCLLYNPRKLTVLIGTKDLIVVNTEEALLICHKDQDQRVKEIVENLKEKGKKDQL
jgi:mannose-1-phosphate guanylyltransferase